MLQVGVDSMNYQLKYTHYSITGQQSNCGITSGNSVITDSNGKYMDKFFIGNADEVLDHYAFTQNPTGGEGGRWYPDRNKDFKLYAILDENQDIASWPTYFIALKAHKQRPDYCYWICETKQYRVNEPNTEDDQHIDDYLYFNWGILTADNNGHYKLTETRGNAYMYGDNLICGVISDIAKKSYFDLTNGNFVLAKGDTTALSYINGVLTIKGVNDPDNVNSILYRLGLVENEEIGGENLLYIKEYSDNHLDCEEGEIYTYDEEVTYYSGSGNSRQHTLIPAGKYVFSADGVEYEPEDYHADITLLLAAFNSSGTIHKTKLIPKGKVRDIVIETTVSCYFCIRAICDGSKMLQQCQGYGIAHNMQLQSGTKSTEYNNYIKHLTSALQGQTDIAGGLILSNLIMLRNASKNVTSGLSGVSDDGRKFVRTPGSQVIRSVNSEGVVLWGGGNYEQALNQAMGLANELPILLTKTGIKSRIGCFEVVSENSIAVYDSAKTYRILLTSGTTMSLKMQQKVNNAWTDLLIINSDNVDIDYDIRTLGKTSLCPTVKTETDTSSTYLIQCADANGELIEKIAVPAGCQCDLSATNTIWIAILSEYGGWYNREVYLYATVSLVKVNGDGTYTKIASHSISGVGATRIDDNSINWNITLSSFTGSPYSIANAGNYGLLLEIDHFYRINGAGVGYEEHVYNDHWSGCTIGVSTKQDIHFSKTSAEDRTIMKIGRNGMLIAHSASSYFLAKNDQTNMDVRIGGLPTLSDSSKPDSLYKSGGHLMIN